MGIVDDDRGDRLVDDPLHDLRDETLLLEPPLGVGVVGLDLVAQVPVREEPHLRGEEALAVAREQVVHPDVVPGDVAVARCAGASDLEAHGGRHALREPLREARLRPFPPCPVAAFPDPLVERRQGEIEQDDERELVREEIVGDVGSRVVARHDLVEGIHRAEIEIRLPAHEPSDLRPMSVYRLEHVLEPREHRVACHRVAGVVQADEGLEGIPAAVIVAPEGGDLRQSPADVVGGVVAVPRDELGLEPRDGGPHPVRLPRRVGRLGQAHGEDGEQGDEW